MEFFPRDTDKYRDVVLGKGAAAAKLGECGEDMHECRCNMCGDDLNSRA